jgi:hypothetical protein
VHLYVEDWKDFGGSRGDSPMCQEQVGQLVGLLVLCFLWGNRRPVWAPFGHYVLSLLCGVPMIVCPYISTACMKVAYPHTQPSGVSVEPGSPAFFMQRACIHSSHYQTNCALKLCACSCMLEPVIQYRGYSLVSHTV